MNDRYATLEVRLERMFHEVDNDIVYNLKDSNMDYALACQELQEYREQHPFIEKVLDDKSDIQLTAQEHEEFLTYCYKWLNLQRMERQEIYFRGQGDMFHLLRRICAF